MNLHTYIPYASPNEELNLGKSYNNFMSIVNDDDWVLFLDHDATFTTKEWYNQVYKIIEENPEYGLFTCFTNRIGNPIQKVRNIDYDNHDIKYHRNIGKTLYDEYKYKVTPWDYKNIFLSGVIILVSKKTWDIIGGAPDGFLGVDNCIHIDCIKNDIKVGLMNGLYVYHWYRGNNENVKKYKTNPYFNSEYNIKRNSLN